MAAGMHAAALGQLGPPTWSRNSVEATVASDATGPVEISELSEEKTREAKQLLQERSLQARPMARYGKMLQCKQQVCQDLEEGNPKSEALPRRKTRSDVVAPVTRFFLNLLPVLSWLPSMSRVTLRSDIIAGITVGIMAIPQSMSYAGIAGLTYQYGLYSACVPTLVYAFFGQSRQLAVGPVAMVSLLISSGLEQALTEEDCPAYFAQEGIKSGTVDYSQHDLCPEEYAKLAMLTAAVVGVMQISAMVLRLGFLVSFLGHPVTSGFTSGAAIIIGLSQVKYMLGVEIVKSEFVYVTLGSIFGKLHETRCMTLLLGLSSLAFLILSKKASQSQKYPRLRHLGPVAPLICCVAATLLIWLCEPLRKRFDVKFVGTIPDGIFPVSVKGWDLSDIAKVLPTALSACLIGYMESIAIGKQLAAKHGYEIDAGQELLALGMANLVGAMFSCYPVTGSFSRSAVNNATGAMTQFSGVVTAIVMLCTLMCLTPLFYYLPNFVLSAIVISSVVPLVAYQEAVKLWKVKKHDFFLWVSAFTGTLFLGVLPGIGLAVGLSLVIVIYESVRPQIMILWRIPGTTIYRNVKQESSGAFLPNVFIARIGSSMYFANASYIKDMLLGYVADLEDVNATEYIILEMSPVVSVDSTAVHVLEDVVADFRGRGIQIAFAMVGNRVNKTLSRAGFTTFMGERWFYPTVHDAVVGCLRHQQAKRQQIFGQSLTTRLSSHAVTTHVILEDSVSPSPDGSDGEESPDLEFGNNEDTLEVGLNPVHPGNEIGFSNDLHHLCTVIFINLVKDVPMIMSDVTAIFQNHQLTICRANIEAMRDASGNEGEGGCAQHVYHVRSLLSNGKLSEAGLRSLKSDLEDLLARHTRSNDLQIEVDDHTSL
eukprot:TRINITY_DN11070_c1_g3_i1.p1 TRINITY_DN11070_c1_g3~~TRINITY_DN11070_c1_g3_i1.p1  ORF type:complete len:878 (+),score=151.23 TRINITY_DN11070_c1_g3_i1:168-2801(+)